MLTPKTLHEVEQAEGGALFLDAGTQLFGPFHYGFELQGDVKRMSQTSFKFSESDVTVVGIDENNWVAFISTNNYTQTYTLWDIDFSPRGYLSFDLGNKLQLLGFAGLNYNWQTIDYTLDLYSGNSDYLLIDGHKYYGGDQYKNQGAEHCP